MANQPAKRNRISFITAVFMITAAVLIDLIQLILGFIPVIGWLISSLISICAWLLFYTWNKLNGSQVSNKQKRMLVNTVMPLIDTIPLIGDFLPTWTVDVFSNIAWVRAEDALYNNSALRKVVQAKQKFNKAKGLVTAKKQGGAVGSEIKSEGTGVPMTSAGVPSKETRMKEASGEINTAAGAPSEAPVGIATGGTASTETVPKTQDSANTTTASNASAGSTSASGSETNADTENSRKIGARPNINTQTNDSDQPTQAETTKERGREGSTVTGADKEGLGLEDKTTSEKEKAGSMEDIPGEMLKNVKKDLGEKDEEEEKAEFEELVTDKDNQKEDPYREPTK